MLYHITNIQSFESIVSNHPNGNLEFWVSHYKDMNDAHELEQLFRYEYNANTIKFAPTVCEDYYILCFTEEPHLTFNHSHGDYGNIIMALDEKYLDNVRGGLIGICRYTDNNIVMPSRPTNIIDAISDFENRTIRFYVKRKEWEHEKEWRLVLNQQPDEQFYPPRQGKQYGFLKRQFPHDILKKVYIREDSANLIDDVKNILILNNSSIPIEILQSK